MAEVVAAAIGEIVAAVAVVVAGATDTSDFSGVRLNRACPDCSRKTVFAATVPETRFAESQLNQP